MPKLLLILIFSKNDICSAKHHPQALKPVSPSILIPKYQNVMQSYAYDTLQNGVTQLVLKISRHCSLAEECEGLKCAVLCVLLFGQLYAFKKKQ